MFSLTNYYIFIARISHKKCIEKNLNKILVFKTRYMDVYMFKGRNNYWQRNKVRKVDLNLVVGIKEKGKRAEGKEAK